MLKKCGVNPEIAIVGKVENVYKLELTTLIMISANPDLTVASTVTCEL